MLKVILQYSSSNTDTTKVEKGHTAQITLIEKNRKLQTRVG
jgi:hypothetical protein